MNTQITATPKLFIGIDIHKKQWSIHFRTDICEHRGFTMPPSTEALFNYVHLHFPDHEISVTFEIGCCGFWAAREMLGLGWKVLVVNPGDVNQSDKHRYQKTDRIDSRHLCRQLQKNELNGIYIPTEAQEQLCSLLRQRNHSTRMLRKQKKLIKASLLYAGITIPDHFDNPNWSHAFLDWLNNLQWSCVPGKESLLSKLRILGMLNQDYLGVANHLRAWCRKHHHKDYYLLKSFPSIGGYLSAAVLAELWATSDASIMNHNSLITLAWSLEFIKVIPAEKVGLTPRSRSLL